MMAPLALPWWLGAVKARCGLGKEEKEGKKNVGVPLKRDSGRLSAWPTRRDSEGG
jgi:hypothetical protein